MPFRQNRDARDAAQLTQKRHPHRMVFNIANARGVFVIGNIGQEAQKYKILYKFVNYFQKMAKSGYFSVETVEIQYKLKNCDRARLFRK